MWDDACYVLVNIASMCPVFPIPLFLGNKKAVVLCCSRSQNYYTWFWAFSHLSFVDEVGFAHDGFGFYSGYRFNHLSPQESLEGVPLVGQCQS